MMRTLIVASMVGLSLVSTLGCGGRSPGATATGTITFAGSPAPAGIRVDFIPVAAGSSMSSGYTDAAGRYDLFFNANLRGVMPGDCIVRLSLSEATGSDGLPTVPLQLRGIRIPQHFGERSQTIRVVKPGANVIDIDVVAVP
jgi:hypothetical protein